MPVKLGELLLRDAIVSPQQLRAALDHQKSHGGGLSKALVELGLVRDEQIRSLLARQYGVPSIDLDHFEADPAIVKIIPAETARKYLVLPLSRADRVLQLAMADPTNVFAMDDVSFMTGYNIEPIVASESALEEAIDQCYGSPPALTTQRPVAPAADGGSSRISGRAAGATREVLDGRSCGPRT